jgi:hypothetical protein
VPVYAGFSQIFEKDAKMEKHQSLVSPLSSVLAAVPFCQKFGFGPTAKDQGRKTNDEKTNDEKTNDEKTNDEKTND